MDGLGPVIKKKAGVTPLKIRLGQALMANIARRTSLTSMETLQKKTPGSNLHGIRRKDNCWICEGWSECKFELRLAAKDATIKIHFDFEHFHPALVPQTSEGIYRVFRMVPPGVHQYFYSVNNERYTTSHLE